MNRKISGPEKAAILLMDLGEEKAAQVLTNLDEKEVQILSNYMSLLNNLDMNIMDSVNKDFYSLLKSETTGLSRSGSDFFKTALYQAKGSNHANTILKNITSNKQQLGSGLETIRRLEPQIIAGFIENEHPQTAAIILAHLEPEVASHTIKEISESKRAEIVHRLATLEKVSPQVLKDLDEALQTEFKYSGAIDENKLGGKTAAAKLMGAMDKATESMILSSIEKMDPETANEIRALRFKFEDIKKLDDESIRLLLSEVASEDLLIAFKTASDELKMKFFTNMSERVAIMLQEDLSLLGPKKISDVEKAQQKIVSICRDLEDKGKIALSGDEALV